MFTYHRDVDAKRFNHYWQEKKVIHELPSASGEALLRLAKPTFWAAAPRGPTIACPVLPTQKGCNTTPSNPFLEQNSSLKQTTLYLLQHQSQDRTVLGRLMLWLFNKYYIMTINPWLFDLVMVQLVIVQHKRKVFYVLCFVFFSSCCFAGR